MRDEPASGELPLLTPVYQDLIVAAVGWREWMRGNPVRLFDAADAEQALLDAVDAAFGPGQPEVESSC